MRRPSLTETLMLTCGLARSFEDGTDVGIVEASTLSLLVASACADCVPTCSGDDESSSDVGDAISTSSSSVRTAAGRARALLRRGVS